MLVCHTHQNHYTITVLYAKTPQQRMGPEEKNGGTGRSVRVFQPPQDNELGKRVLPLCVMAGVVSIIKLSRALLVLTVKH